MIKSLKIFSILCLLPSLAFAQVPQLQLPDGFEATLFLDNSYAGRHLAVRNNGDVYMSTRSRENTGNIIAMRDTDNDGVADQVESFSNINGTGLEFYNGMLYASDNTTVYRFHFEGDELVPAGLPEIVVSGFIMEQQHADKAFTFDNRGNIYIGVGAPSNACMREARTPGSPGMQPCPLLERYGGIWRFDANELGQDQVRDGEVYATGIRNVVALDWNSAQDALFFLQHGRDQLDILFPQFYGPRDNAFRTAEEFLKVEEAGQTFGWPYTYYDALRDERMQNPEYGGNGQNLARNQYPEPIIAFPAHWAPNEILFYTGGMFPESYRNGAFIAFHGSWNRAPVVQDGFNVTFVSGNREAMDDNYQIFADGFRGDTDGFSSAARPVGLAQGIDGSLYVSDSVEGKIWKITYDNSLGQ